MLPTVWPDHPEPLGKRAEALRSAGRTTDAGEQGNTLVSRGPGTSVGGLPLPLLRRTVRPLTAEAVRERRLARSREPFKGGGDDGVAAVSSSAEASS